MQHESRKKLSSKPSWIKHTVSQSYRVDISCSVTHQLCVCAYVCVCFTLQPTDQMLETVEKTYQNELKQNWKCFVSVLP